MKNFRMVVIVSLLMTFLGASFALGEERIKVAIIPFKINSPEKLDYLEGAIYDMLASRLSIDKNVIVLERAKIEKSLGKDYSTSMDENNAVSLGKRVGADYVVLGSLTKLGETFSLDAKMYDVAKKTRTTSAYAQGSGMDALIPKINEFARNMNFIILGYVPAEGVAGYTGTQTENPNFIFATRDLMSKSDFRKSPFWDIQIKGVEVGDIDGDEINETIVIDRNDLWVYKRGKEEFELLMKYSGKPLNNFLTVDVLNLNNNEYDEIFITNVDKGRLRSFVLEYDPKKKELVRIENNIDYYFRVFALPGKTPILLGQKMGMGEPFYGPIYELGYRNGEYVETRTLNYPSPFKIYGITLPLDIDYDGKLEIVKIDDENHLRIVSPSGDDEWKTKEYWGGVVNYFNTKEEEEKKAVGADPDEEGQVFIPGRIFVTDLNHDGLYELLVNKNISETINLIPKFRLYETSEIYNLAWDGVNLSENWRSRLIDGYVADYQLKDVDTDGIDELVVAVVFSFEMTALVPPSSGVLIYELSF